MTLPLEQELPSTSRVNWGSVIGKLGPLIGLIFVYLLFAILTNTISGASKFATLDNFQLMLRQTSIVAIAALGMTLIIISGGIDLSVGSNIALATIVLAHTLNYFQGKNGVVPAFACIAAAA